MVTIHVKPSDGVSIYRQSLEEQGYQIVKVTGMNPVNTVLNTGALSGIDGEYFISSQLAARNIVITLKPLDSEGKSIEYMRLQAYNIFREKQLLDLRFKTENRRATISGYVESIEVDPFQNPQLIQVSILCPDPFFRTDAQTQDLQYAHGSDSQERAYVQFRYDDFIAVPNGELGFILEMTANADIAKAQIYTYGIDGSTISGISSGDKIVYDTRTGSKKITKNGVPYFSGYDGDFRQMRQNADSNTLSFTNIYLSDADGNRLNSELVSGTVTIYPQYWGL